VTSTRNQWVNRQLLPHMLCVTNMLLHGIDDPSFVRHDNTLARPYISYGKSDRVDIVLTNPPFGGEHGARRSELEHSLRARRRGTHGETSADVGIFENRYGRRIDDDVGTVDN